jgi:tetratricopeptide (TPR) repeat protein
LANDDLTKVETAISLLEEVAGTTEVAQKQQAVHEECLYLLGELLTRVREWPKAEQRLRSALTAYPDSPKAVKGRLQFGQCFRHRANVEARRIEADRALLAEIKSERVQLKRPSHRIDEYINIEDRINQTWKNYDDFLKQAYETIRQAEEQLAQSPNPEPELLKRASFYAADCANWLGLYDDCATRYAKLVERYRNKVEELEALRDLHRCCSFAIAAANEAKNPTDAERWSVKQGLIFKQLKETYTRIPDREMDNTMDVRKRGYWEQWLKENTPRAAVRE